MTGVLLLALFSEVNWSLCKHADASAWLNIEIGFDGTVVGPQLLVVAASNLGFPAVTDHKCRVNLRAISTFCTGLLTVFMDSEVTGLAGLTSYLLLWKTFGTVPG